MPRTVPSTIRDYIDDFFPELMAGTRSAVPFQQAAHLRVLVNLIRDLPPHLVPQDRADYALFLTFLEVADAHLRRWEEEGERAGQLKWMPVRGGEERQNPVKLIRQILSRCDDESSEEADAALSFIGDSGFRRQLRIDIAAAERAFSGGEFKAATVLAGSVVEALLLLEIERVDEKDLEAAAGRLKLRHTARLDIIDRGDLGELVRIANELMLFSSSTLSAANLARDFRNLIHPAVARRTAMEADRATAHSALGAVYHLVRELEVRAGKQ